jgi:cephalosporin-C deacetylase-like acetyl esterase
LTAARSLAFVLAAAPLLPIPPAGDTPRARLERFLNERAHRSLRSRQDAVARVTTPAALADRRRWARETVLRLVGGLPTTQTPLQARVTGRHQREGFAVENVVYESLPGFPVTANVYLPAGGGRRPAIIASAGHGPLGKEGERWGPDLARKGFVVLAYDPLGQGERLQHYDPALRASRAGGATEEHGQAAARAELIGESVARYFIWDAMRGVDYLAGRPEVDPERIGAVGCSGGGTVTTYLAALDERIKAASVACYITSWSALMDGPGPQEAEQSLAGFLSAGLDMGDYLALIAPRPLLIVSTMEDFFPLPGARAVYQEAQRFYALDGAGDRVAWSVSAGGHGVTREGREAVAGFFLRRLGGNADPREEPDVRFYPEDLACTETGQVSTSLQARTVAELIAERAPTPTYDRASVVAAVRRNVDLPPSHPAPELTVHGSVARPGYRLDVVSFAVDDGLVLWGALAIPEGAGRRPAVLIADPRIRQWNAASSGDLDRLAGAGSIVLAIELRGALTAADPALRASLLGPLAAMHRRAAVVGTSLVAIRAADVVHAVDVLAARPDVDAGRLQAYGGGPFAIPLLHAAVIDPRIARVTLEETPLSYRSFLEHPLHRNLPEMLVPGVLRDYDIVDLLLALAPRPVAVVDPVDAVGQRMRRAELTRVLGGAPVRVLRRGPGETRWWE